MSDRERLAKMLYEQERKRCGGGPVAPAWDFKHYLDRADDVLAVATVTLPPAPEPPALVTEEDVARSWDEFMVPRSWGHFRSYGPKDHVAMMALAAACTQSAIRRAVERKTDADHVRLDADGKHCTYIQHVSVRSILALFGLDGGAS